MTVVARGELVVRRSSAVAKRVVRAAKRFSAVNENGGVKNPEFEEFLDDLIGFIWNSQKDFGISWDELRIKANISRTTLDRLMWRETKRPQLATIHSVMRALGFRVTFVLAEKPLGEHEPDLPRYRKDARKMAA